MMKRKLMLVSLVVMALVCSGEAFAQKKREKTKDKRYEPLIKQSADDYAGAYLGIENPLYYVEVEAGRDGALRLVSYEAGRRATVQDVKLVGSMLTGTKVYEDGTTINFRGEFARRILNGRSVEGLIVRDGIRVDLEGGVMLTSLFYRRN